MNGFWLLIPILVIRFIFLGLLNRPALERASHSPLMNGKAKTSYWVYQISTLLLFLYPFFLKIDVDNRLFLTGLIIYGLSIVVCSIATYNFARPELSGVNISGLYRISRNPMYLGYFLYFLGCVLLVRSAILLVILIVFQISAHWIIRAEERWCLNAFGEEYRLYMSRVRRYF